MINLKKIGPLVTAIFLVVVMISNFGQRNTTDKFTNDLNLELCMQLALAAGECSLSINDCISATGCQVDDIWAEDFYMFSFNGCMVECYEGGTNCCFGLTYTGCSW